MIHLFKSETPQPATSGTAIIKSKKPINDGDTIVFECENKQQVYEVVQVVESTGLKQNYYFVALIDKG